MDSKYLHNLSYTDLKKIAEGMEIEIDRKKDTLIQQSSIIFFFFRRVGGHVAQQMIFKYNFKATVQHPTINPLIVTQPLAMAT